MAFRLKGFRLRRKAAKNADPAHPVPVPEHTEKILWSERIQNWISQNPHWVRNTVFGTVGLCVLVVLILVLRAAAQDSHSKALHTALEKYDELRIIPKGEVRQKQMKEFGLSLKGTCEQTFQTIESSAACLTAGNALLEGRDFEGAAEAFRRAASGYSADSMVSVAEFMQAEALESAGKFDEALKVYGSLEKKYTAIKKGEIAIFNEGRMLLYLGRYDDAEEKFSKLAPENEGKEFSALSREYLSLIQLKRKTTTTPVGAPKK